MRFVAGTTVVDYPIRWHGFSKAYDQWRSAHILSDMTARQLTVSPLHPILALQPPRDNVSVLQCKASWQVELVIGNGY